MSAARKNAAIGLRSTLVLALLALIVSACAREEKARSKDVEVVDNQQNAWSAATAWRLAPAPLVSIGRVDGPPEYQLFRVMDALRLDDGTIVIANNGTGQVRFYDHTGRFVRSVGALGSGPEEYNHLRMLRRFGGDSLITWDTQLARGTILALDGRYARTLTPPRAARFSNYVGVFADGSLLGLRFGLELPVREAAVRYHQESRLKPQDVLAFRLTSSGSVDSIGKFFLNEMFVSPTGTTEPPFGRAGAFATAGDHFYYGTTNTYEIRMYTPQGKLARIVRAARPNAPLTRSMIDAYTSARLAHTPDPEARRNLERVMSEIPLSNTVPAFSDLLVDAAGNLWVSAFHLRDETAHSWTVFDRDGHLLGDLEVPPRFTIYDIGQDYVLGRTRDESDVEHVVLYRLVKPASR